MEGSPLKEFGKRRPMTEIGAAAAPVKRSRHVALLLTGAFAIGGSAYALMPHGNCEPKDPATAATSPPSTNMPCQPRSSSSSGVHSYSHGWWSRSSFYGGDSASPATSTSTSTASGSGEVTRGGFGGFARAFAAHFSGGG